MGAKQILYETHSQCVFLSSVKMHARFCILIKCVSRDLFGDNRSHAFFCVQFWLYLFNF